MSSEPTTGPAPSTAGADGTHDSVTVRAPKGLRGALVRFRIMAFATGVLLAFMATIGIPYRLIASPDPLPTWYSVGWMLHGWLYVAYVAVSLDLVFRLRWHLGKALLILLAGTVPYMSFVAERYVSKRVEPLLEPSS